MYLPTDPYTAINPESILLAMAAAIDAEETVKVRYLKEGAKRAENRHFAPGILKKTESGATVVIGHDFKRDDARTYRLDRIAWVERNPQTREA